MEYREIKVFLHTNLESLEEDKRNILFESSLLHHPELKSVRKLRKYPSVSINTSQNYDALSELTYPLRMQFFFNVRSHLPLLRTYPNLFNKARKTYNSQTDPKEYFRQYNEIIKKNIEMMLTLLFVASPLNSVNVFSSWEIVTGQLQLPRLPSVYGFIRGVSDKTLIDIQGKRYSFDRLIWMNDILNCPVYAELFTRYREFLRWRENEYKKIRTVALDVKDKSGLEASIKENLSKMKASITKIYDKALEFYLCYFFTITNEKGVKTKTEYLDQKNLFGFYKLYILKYVLDHIEDKEPPKIEKTFYEDIKPIIIDRGRSPTCSIPGRKPMADSGIKTSLTQKNALYSDNKTNFYNRIDNIIAKAFQIETSSKTENKDDKKLVESRISRYIFNEKNSVEKNKKVLNLARNVLAYKYDGEGTWTLEGWANEFSTFPFTGIPTGNILDSDKTIILNEIRSFISNVKLCSENLARLDPEIISLQEADKKTKILDNLLKETIEENSKIYAREIQGRVDTQYLYFVDQYIRNELSYQNKSTNSILQNLINLKSKDDVRKFFEFIDRTYKYYYEGVGEPFAQNDPDLYLLYTGVNTKYDSGRNLIYEIHVLCDLYLGSSGKLYGEQNCELKSQEVGKNLELVLTANVNTPEKNRQKWDLNYRRVLYSDGGESSAAKDARAPTKGQPTTQPGRTSKNAAAANIAAKPRETTKDARPFNVNAGTFQDIIETVEKERKQIYEKNRESTREQLQEAFNKKYPISRTKKEGEKVDYSLIWYPDNSTSYLTQINEILRRNANVGRGVVDVTPSNVLNILRDSKEQDERKLYDIYVKYNKDLKFYNRNIIEELNRLSNNLYSDILNARRRQEEMLRTQNAQNNEQFLALSLLCAKYYFYRKIISEIEKREDNDKQKLNVSSDERGLSRMGGRRVTRRNGVKKNNVSRKN